MRIGTIAMVAGVVLSGIGCSYVAKLDTAWQVVNQPQIGIPEDQREDVAYDLAESGQSKFYVQKSDGSWEERQISLTIDENDWSAEAEVKEATPALAKAEPLEIKTMR